MKIQNLAVIFIIIILPISLILTAYVENQVKTLDLQLSYDTKLTNATYDAVKAFQLNTINSSTSDLANSKLRDIKASANTFFNSVATQFNMSGYNKDVLKGYVPALVYTMYDGYYIYSPFKNTLTDTTVADDATYKNDEWETDLKPYIHYSCRYVKEDYGIDVVITYSLDNYITVKGTINNKAVNKAGYLINRNNINISGENVTYRKINIGTEELKENIKAYNEDETSINDFSNISYTKINGVKYYKNRDKWFSVMNGVQHVLGDANYTTTNKAGQLYYKEANDFTDWLEGDESKIRNLTPKDIVDEEGNKINNDLFNSNENIFTEDENGISIEDPDSKFNQHRLAVIRYSIEKNLSIAIANYNSYSNATTEFRMPKLKEDEWNKILNNVSVISFLQGLSIGGKIYNGYSIVTNTKTEEVVNTDSIYLISEDREFHSEFHRVTENNLTSKNIVGAYLNNDFEAKRITDNQNATKVFFLHGNIDDGGLTASYSSIIMQTNVIDIDDNEYGGNIYKYVASLGNNAVSQKYFTALGRERYSMYKTNNNVNEIINKLSQ